MSKYACITLIDHFHPTARLVPDLILTLCQTKIAERESSYRSDFMSCASPPIQFLTTSDGKATKSLLFSFNSRNQR